MYLRNFNRCTVHFEIYVFHTPTNALFINLVKSFKFTLKDTIISLFIYIYIYIFFSLKTETCRSDIIVFFNVNLKLLTKLINSAFVGV